MDRSNSFYKLIRSKTVTHTITGHNIHENNGKHQKGGMTIVAFDILATKVEDK